MSSIKDDAARRAAEAARRELAKKAAEAAAKQAAAELAKRAAETPSKQATQAAARLRQEALRQKAGARPAASSVRQAFGQDELSKGLGRALRSRAASTLGGPSSLPVMDAAAYRKPPVIPSRSAGIMSPAAAAAFRRRMMERELRDLAKTARAPSAKPGVAEQAAKDFLEATKPPPIDFAKKGRGWLGAVTGPLQAQRDARATQTDAALEHLHASLARATPAEREAILKQVGPRLESLAVDSLRFTPEQRDTFNQGIQQLQSTLPPDQAGKLGDRLATAQVEHYAAQVHGEVGEIGKADGQGAKNEATLDASARVADILESAPPGLRAAILEEAEGDLTTIAQNARALGTDDTHQLVAHFARAADLVGPTAVHLLTEPIADVIAQGGLLQRGDDAGLFGQNKHHSEAEFKDGVFNASKDGLPGGELFQQSMVEALARKDKAGLAGAFATGDDVPRNFTGSIATLPGKAAGAVEAAIAALGNKVGDAIREGAAEVLDIDGNIDRLNSAGDSFTLHLGGEIGFTTFQVGGSVEMTVTKSDPGYDLTLTGEASAGVFAKLGMTGFGAGVEGEANATGRVSATFHFDDKAAVTQAAETVGGIGVATAVGSVPGALITGLSAGEEIAAIKKANTQTVIELELSAEAKAELGKTAGLGAGGSVSGTVTNSVAVVLQPGKPPELRLNQSLSVDGSLNVGAPISVPGAGELSGSLSASASLEFSTTIPFPKGFSAAEVVKDPVGAVKRFGKSALQKGTTTIGGNIELSAASGGKIPGLKVEGENGVQIGVSATAPTGQVIGALGSLLSGNVRGAFEKLDDETDVSLTVDVFSKQVDGIDEEFGVPGAKIAVEATETSIDEQRVFELEGTPSEIIARAGDVLDVVFQRA